MSECLDLKKTVCPVALKPWLLADDSLTERLQALRRNVRIELLTSEWKISNWWDKAVLGLAREQCFVREILMMSDEQPQWYARTVIPPATYTLKQQKLDSLNTQSLGSLLHTEKGFTRTQLLYYPIHNEQIEYHWVKQHLPKIDEVLWVRRSIYEIESQPLYLMEIFLPDLLTLLCRH